MLVIILAHNVIPKIFGIYQVLQHHVHFVISLSHKIIGVTQIVCTKKLLYKQYVVQKCFCTKQFLYNIFLYKKVFVQ